MQLFVHLISFVHKGFFYETFFHKKPNIYPQKNVFRLYKKTTSRAFPCCSDVLQRNEVLKVKLFFSQYTTQTFKNVFPQIAFRKTVQALLFAKAWSSKTGNNEAKSL